MKGLQTQQVNASEIPNFDLVIAASGYEERATFIANFFVKELFTATKICLAFSINNENKRRKQNDRIFKTLGYSQFLGNGDDDLFVERAVKESLKNIAYKEELNVLIDYSSMTRLWYASLLRYFHYSTTSFERINLFFTYSYANYEAPPKQLVRNIHVSPIEGYSTFYVPDKPTALIIGLGYEPEKAFGLTEYFDAETFLFYNDTSKGRKFAEDVRTVNKDLIDSIPSKNVYQYPINDLVLSEYLLYDLCRALKEKYRVVIAPCGPKPFTLISLLVSLKLSGVDVWRISPGNNALPIKRAASGDFSIYKVQLIKKFNPSTPSISHPRTSARF